MKNINKTALLLLILLSILTGCVKNSTDDDPSDDNPKKGNLVSVSLYDKALPLGVIQNETVTENDSIAQFKTLIESGEEIRILTKDPFVIKFDGNIPKKVTLFDSLIWYDGLIRAIITENQELTLENNSYSFVFAKDPTEGYESNMARLRYRGVRLLIEWDDCTENYYYLANIIKSTKNRVSRNLDWHELPGTAHAKLSKL